MIQVHFQLGRMVESAISMKVHHVTVSNLDHPTTCHLVGILVVSFGRLPHEGSCIFDTLCSLGRDNVDGLLLLIDSWVKRAALTVGSYFPLDIAAVPTKEWVNHEEHSRITIPVPAVRS